MLEEELKNEEVVEQPAQEEPRQEVGAVDPNKVALTVFILCCIALVLCSGWIIGPIASFILVLIAKGKLDVAAKADKNPYKVFYKICKIAWWSILIIAILAFIGWVIGFIVWLVALIAAAAEAAAESGVVAFLF